MSWTQALQLAIAVLAFAGAGWWSRRSRGDPSNAPRFFVRLMAPAAMLAGAVTAMVAVEPNPAGLRTQLPLLVAILVTFLLVAILAILLIELLAWRLRPVRTRTWLVASTGLFGTIFLLLPAALIAWLQPSAGARMVDWDLLEFVGLIAASAILWWSHLPASRPGLASVFE